MLKKILSLKGVHQLSKDEQSEFIGGSGSKPRGCCDPAVSCCVPQPIPHSCAAGGCAQPDSNCLYAYGVMNCPDPIFGSCCI